MTRPFRFAVTMPPPRPPLSKWHDSLHRIEDLGIGTIVAADHFTQGYDFEPMVALTAAASATANLRLQTGVLGNDYRHPVLVHRMAALLDVVSNGRLVLGLGAGWMTSDYEAAGITLGPPGARIGRLEESIAVIKGLFADEPCTFEGEHYRVAALDGLPKPVQRPRPPFFIGGGSPRVLRLAGREADIVGINASLAAGELGAHAIRDLSQARVAEKVEWVREGAEGAGRSLDDLELEMNHWLARITSTPAEADDFLVRVGTQYDVDPALLADSPSVLVGTVGQCIETLIKRRQALGLSYLQLDAGFPTPHLEAFAPVVAALTKA
jgi:probable F420-dependent oxidoreductase